MKNFFACITVILMLHSRAWAQGNTPIGFWKSFDDITGKPSALVRITEVAGKLQGRIEKIFPEPGESDHPLCSECEGALKDQPVVGMIILSGMQRNGDEYSEGEILDPDNGKRYRCTMKLLDDGKKLSLRGYIGLPLLGRSQIWLREE
jgi:uncharacterized protein (DUF2147 family)